MVPTQHQKQWIINSVVPKSTVFEMYSSPTVKPPNNLTISQRIIRVRKGLGAKYPTVDGTKCKPASNYLQNPLVVALPSDNCSSRPACRRPGGPRCPDQPWHSFLFQHRIWKCSERLLWVCREVPSYQFKGGSRGEFQTHVSDKIYYMFWEAIISPK